MHQWLSHTACAAKVPVPLMAGAGSSSLDRALCWEEGLGISGVQLPFFKSSLKLLQALESGSKFL